MIQYAYAKTKRGKWHRAVVTGSFFTNERCNLDDAKGLHWSSIEPDPAARRCKWCYREEN